METSFQRSATPLEKAEDFIQNETQFHLGALTTEQSHPKTRTLSQTLESDVPAGMRQLFSVDDDLPPVLKKTIASDEFAKLENAIYQSLAAGGRVSFSGCGATGRLSILLDASNKKFCRQSAEKLPEHAEFLQKLALQTNAIMTGGDFALIRSVESFEDFISFGKRQFKESGIGPNDTLVAISEGGETSSVIGTIHAALEAGIATFFLFNNPSDLMASRVERSRAVIEDPRVTVVNLTTGPMAIAGSTRMQATTIELLVAGFAFETALMKLLKETLSADEIATLGFEDKTPEEKADAFDAMLAEIRSDANVATAAEYVNFECELYKKGGRVTYFARDYSLDIFTDTTERSPTFKIPPFRSLDETDAPAPWAFVKDPQRSAKEAWIWLLGGVEPRCLEWTSDDYRAMGGTEAQIADPPQIGRQTVYRFPIGNEDDPSRYEVSPNAAVAVLADSETKCWGNEDDEWFAAYIDCAKPFEQKVGFLINNTLNEAPAFSDVCPCVASAKIYAFNMAIPATPLDVFVHIALKLVLNNISSATMGKFGRLNGNWMAHVDATNKKLIDRSVRLVSEIAKVDYRTACITLFEALEEMDSWSLDRKKTISPAAYAVELLQKKNEG
jgi:N-acetylmuramic acid 6-phosphate etherase